MVNFRNRPIARPTFAHICRRVGILIAVLALWGQGVPQSAAEENKNPEKFESVLIMPVIDMSDVYGPDASVRGPVSGEFFVTDAVAPVAVKFISAAQWKRLRQMALVELVEPKPAAIDTKTGLVPVQGTRSERIAAIQAAGRQVGADGVLCTYVYAFRKRVGTDFGVEAPAMVSFESVLVSVASGRVVWQESFSETQQTLNENLLRIGKFLRRKGRWVTAEEMAGRAVDDMMKKFSESLQEK